MRMRTLSIGVCALVMSAPLRVAHAAPAGVVPLLDQDIFETSQAGTTITCGNLPPWTPGRMVRGQFYPASAEIKNLKKNARRAKDATKKSQLKNKLAKRRSYQRSASSVCSGGPPDTNGGAKFDSAGNVTAAGKIAFGIPSTMSANVNSGIGDWTRTCRGCHLSFPSSLSIKSYPGILARIQQSPMFFQVPLEVSEQQIANITAFANYLNAATE